MPYRNHARTKKRPTPKVSSQLEMVVLFMAIVEPLMTIPQIVQIYVDHNTGASMLTWALYLPPSIIWLVYGIKIRNIPIIVADILWVTVELLVVVGLLTLR